MTRSRLLGIFGFLLSLSFPCLAAEPFLKIDESKIRLDINTGALLHLPVTNTSAQPISTRLTLDFLDSWNEVVYSLGREVTVQHGATLVEFSIPEFLKLDDAKRSHYGWLRMRYSFSDDVSGIVSVSRIAPEPFVLKVLKQRRATGDFPYQVQIVAQDSAAGTGKGGVDVKGTLTFDGDSKPVVLRTTAHTNSQGGATLEFNIPRMPPESEAELEVTAQLGSFVRTVTDSFDLSDEIQVITTTDKPIYQPGQKLRLRFLAFDHARRALEKVPFDVTISDSGQSNVFETHVLTSRFGEAHVEWAIPASARLGDYAIEIVRPDSYRSTYHRVRVDRYDLPNFSADVKPDRPYYLPRQNARIEVRADYLFGQPVKKGNVKIVREQERRWDYRTLKWVVEEGRTVEGLTGEDGRLLVSVDLEDEHDSLEQSQRDKFRDIEYAAYVTDPTSNRTEQRRFSVRIAASPIQIYVLGNFDQRAGYPMEFYLSASYADGKPALCNIEILESPEEGGRRLGVAKTNKYGVAKVTGLVSPPQWADERYHARLKFKARDSEGLTGDDNVYFYVKDEVVRVRTDKALYRAADSVSVRIESSRSAGTVLLNVLRDEKPIYRRTLRLASGRASTVIPNFAALKGNILVSAYVPGNSGQSDGYGIRVVAFPDDGELQLDARPNKIQYKPGEEAAIRLQVRNASGQPEESLLGISIIDKAVDERARTDSSFGAYRSFCPYCWSFWGITAEVAGLTRRDLDRVDRSRPVPADLELLAEVLLAVQEVDTGSPEEIDDSPSIPRASDEIWRHNFEDRFAAINAPPADEEELRAVIAAADPGIALMRDPWGNPLKFSGDVISDRYVVRLVSAGPDEMFHSADDFQMGQLTWRYFADNGKRIQLALSKYHTQTGVYIRDYSTLRSELLRAGDDFEAWRDPWGRPYRAQFGISNTRYTVTIQSEGRDGNGSVDVWVAGTDYTSELRASLDTSLNRFYRDQDTFPETETQFQAAMQAAGISQSQLTDPWGRAYYPIFKTRYAYVDRITIQAGAVEARNITPVTEQVRIVSVRSAGPDGMEGTSDDFEIATFVQPAKEQAVEDPNPRISESLIFSGLNGAVRAVVVDSSGALIPGVSAIITTSEGRTLEALTDAEGGFMLRNLPPGVYRVELSLPGFQRKVISALRVNAGTVTNVVATLEVGSVSTQIEVSTATEILLASAASVGEVRREIFPGQRNAPISTPRLREYFPETLLWQPSLETGAEGTALIRFKLADSITTWKVSAIASTADGRIGLVEKEILSTQPFFLDHDPPKVLTRGDEIALPVVVRSYLETAQSLELSMKPESWFTPLDSLMRTFHIESGEARREIFTFKAATDARDVKQRVTGLGTKASDAIEKSLSVFPYGQEIHQTSSGILRGTSTQEVVVPHDTIPGSVRAELKIYPNLMAHVVDAIEGIMKRPYGCAEQTISSAYPSLLFLRYSRQTGQKPNEVSEKAARYLEIGYGRLLNYQTADGGFAYWTHDRADIAVTAYAIRFLHEAGDFLKVDKAAIDKAYDWLLTHQSSNGSWDSDTTLTALVAEVLSAPGIRRKDKDPIPHALAFLSAAMGSSEPYPVAMSALAALNAGDNELAERALARLERMTHREGDSAYWDLQTNTPFYGWGLPGRLETTAIVVRAFAAGRSVTSPLVDQGLSFLLKNKDHFGVWYSTQATVKTLEALAMLIGSRATDAEGAAEIRVNGAPVASITFGNKQRPTSPVTLDISQFLSPGANRIEVRQTKGGSAATIQVVESHYLPWAASPQEHRGALRLAVRFDKTEAAVSDEITASVSAERVGFKGYGMLLAEIGLPPGADVDRASLERAMANAGGIQSYDVLPDRIVAYLWPRAGGVQFEFKFRPRYGIRALTAASSIYDYYNPEERAVVSPVRFLVR